MEIVFSLAMLPPRNKLTCYKVTEVSQILEVFSRNHSSFTAIVMPFLKTTFPTSTSTASRDTDQLRLAADKYLDAYMHITLLPYEYRGIQQKAQTDSVHITLSSTEH